MTNTEAAAATSPTAADALVLRTLRIRGLVDTGAMAAGTGLSTGDVEGVLRSLEGGGLVKHRTGRVQGWSLTPDGRARAAQLVDDDVVQGADREQIEQAYADFLPVNRSFKALCTEWQTGPAAGDPSFTGRLDEVHAGVATVIGRAAVVRTRFDRYTDRLGAALERFRGGDTAALARPMSDSYHDVWMELHEDLLLTLGRARTDEDE